MEKLNININSLLSRDDDASKKQDYIFMAILVQAKQPL